MTWCTDPSASVLRIDAPLTADQVAEIRRRWQATAPTTGLLALTEPWAELPAGPALVLLEQHPDGTSLVAPWRAHINAIWASAPHFTDHRHHNGPAACPICG